MIAVDNLSKSYGKQTLFDDISFKVNRRERVGVVGRNGHGKTTLFRIIMGLEDTDAGSVTLPRNYRIGYVEQRLEFTEATAMAEAARALPPDGRNEFWRVEKVLVGLGFEASDLAKPPAELSGGFQVRLNLAKVLLADFQMLLLDEPTNYLDITSIRWLERYLLAWPGELLLITHDRGFMDRVVTHILGLHRAKARKIAGDTEKYYIQIAQEEEIYEQTRLNDARKQKEMELFINRFRAKARLAGLVQSRVKSLEKMEKKDKLEKLKTLDFSFTEKPFHHKYALDAQDLSFGYEPGRPLIEDFHLCVGARDRVFIIGPNGRGKTTLIKLLAGALTPRTGQVTMPQAAGMGWFEQTNVATLSGPNTVLEEIARANPGAEPKIARQIAGAMMFEDDDALKTISVLSGGEKSRVMLGQLLATPLNLLLLDEPTNHLDLEAADALLAAIDAFDGAVVMVTHNEMFLHALAERLVVFDGGRIFVHEGGYQAFLDKVGWREEGDRPVAEESPEAAPRPKPTPAELRKLRADIVARRSKILRPLEKRMTGIETAIETKDRGLREIDGALIEASQAKNGSRVVELSKTMHDLKNEIDGLLEELEKLTIEHEASRSAFEKSLKELEDGEGA
jgi:ATP-binding cassette subfamily F protein 3